MLHHASPVVHEGHAYLVTKAGVVHCLDAATGETRYTHRLAEPCWATPVAAGGRVYYFGKGGVTTVLAAGAKPQRLAVSRLWTPEGPAARREAANGRPEDRLPARPPPPKRKGGEKAPATRGQM